MKRTKQVIFEYEPPLRKALYERTPLVIVEDFLGCIDDDGVQTIEFPPHVIEAMAKRLRMLMGPNRTLNSLDQAFGGRIARQRNAIEERDKTGEIVWQHIMARKEAKNQPQEKRSGTPFEIATEEVASRAGVSDESIKRRYRLSAKK